ncbi:MAG: hypothetical protein AAEJ04_07795, partial [Planctomycetota bacterium]
QKSILKAHAALQSLSPQRRAQLIQRIREIQPGQSAALVAKVSTFMTATEDERKKVQRRRNAMRMWHWNLTQTEKDQFSSLPPRERTKFLRSILKQKESELLAKLPSNERREIEGLPNQKRWNALGLRNPRGRAPDSPQIGRVLFLASKLTRQEMSDFITTGNSPDGHPSLKTSLEILNDDEMTWVRKFLQRGLHSRRQPGNSPPRRMRNGREGPPGGLNPRQPDQQRDLDRPGPPDRPRRGRGGPPPPGGPRPPIHRGGTPQFHHPDRDDPGHDGAHLGQMPPHWSSGGLITRDLDITG